MVDLARSLRRDAGHPVARPAEPGVCREESTTELGTSAIAELEGQ